ncbi:hypothetical protein Tsubulata_033983 [Turnera subulata]|uniref:C3HC-type domain-containing protein n=1 Tax=Turnera subulata TaxID=218843 RepID=A0A9Q0FGL0_9ROSI|nr:hypothetical protein Tsubulata_033983 [Turnera subulata]
MAEDPEKRFHSIMDKLFHAPKSTNSSSSSGVQLTRGRKRPNPETALALVEPNTRGSSLRLASSAPACRPWDRGDLMRRLATFKSMTWFAKPKVVSAVNCARRGWINVDMDTIACEACGARLFFTTPASWSQQQGMHCLFTSYFLIEKAALVFSLQLDKGHKLLCPWIDNACEERLAEFPPTPLEVLVETFRERYVALSQLLALPVISSSAIERMRSPQLEEFLRQPLVLEYGSGLADDAQIASPEDRDQAGSANLYYQAQKLLSLCGWEPRALPYVVDRKDITKDADGCSSSSMVTSGHNRSIDVRSGAMGGSLVSKEDTGSRGESYADPNSIVLDCRLCGASVGLWTFSMVPQPIEFFRVVGSTEVSERNSGQDSSGVDQVGIRGGFGVSSSHGTLSHRPSDSTLTIAGGPPPTKQNFKATISLPIIGRNLRARFSHDSNFRDHSLDNVHMSSEGAEVTGPATPPETARHDTFVERPNESTPDRSDQSEMLPAKAAGSLVSTVGVSAGSQVSGTSVPDPDASLIIGNGNDALVTIAFDDIFLEGQEFDISCSNNTICMVDSGEKATSSDIQKAVVAQEKGQGVVKDGTKIPETGTVAYGTGKELRQPALDKAMEFDPVKQHRHFCPWILSTNSGAPGWQQTLAALQRQKEPSDPKTSSPPSSSFIKVDDPITSVRKLFMSPSAKRLKPT